MDKTYEKFLRSGMDLAAVGIECRRENTQYFCTPKGASVFGWAGTDGIHFCFIRGFGGMVFSVNPMNESQRYVHPLAKDFIEEVSFGKGRGDGHVDSKKNLYSDFCAKSGGVCDSKR